jgi:hypothetical protein
MGAIPVYVGERAGLASTGWRPPAIRRNTDDPILTTISHDPVARAYSSERQPFRFLVLPGSTGPRRQVAAREGT